MAMALIVNLSTNPAFNLALEEYALTQMKQDVIMLWRNSASVIIGRNQNAVEEMDLDYIHNNNITVIRRQSGGGAVFHDLGNINFTVIHALGNEDFSNYNKFTAPIRDFLQSLGVDAKLQGRNDLVIDGMKFSGNAQAVKQGRIMHHGTILFDADMNHLAKALKPNPAKIESKGIRSTPARVTNVARHLPVPMSVDEFFDRLIRYFRERTENREYSLSSQDVEAVNRLVSQKYATWDWNFGKSPAYNYRNTARFDFGIVDIRLLVEGGIIREAHIFGDFFGVSEVSELEDRLCGIRHDKEHIRHALEHLPAESFIHGITLPRLLELF